MIYERKTLFVHPAQVIDLGLTQAGHIEQVYPVVTRQQIFHPTHRSGAIRQKPRPR